MTRTRLVTRAFLIPFLVLALTATGAACGGQSQPAGSIKVTMTEFKFNPSSTDTKAGKVVLYLVNAGSVSHDLVVQDSAGKSVARSPMVSAGDTATVTIDNLATGSYTLICDVPGHADSGMKGTLVVGG